MSSTVGLVANINAVEGRLLGTFDITLDAPALDNSWKTIGTGDYNGDGKADILWRNDDGRVALWQMNGATVTSSTLTSVAADNNGWKIAAPII